MSNDDDDFLDMNPDSAWLETTTIGGFRVWHIIAICLGILLSIVIMVCCCIRFRIPRTKQEIEADYQRKQITKKFREKLQQIKNSEMDDMDLQKDWGPPNSFKYRPNYSDNATFLPGVHLAWECKESMVALKSPEAGYVALSCTSTKQTVFRRCFEGPIVYPTTHLNHKDHRQQFKARDNVVGIHQTTNKNSYRNDMSYHHIRDPYAGKEFDVINGNFDDKATFAKNLYGHRVYPNELSYEAMQQYGKFK